MMQAKLTFATSSGLEADALRRPSTTTASKATLQGKSFSEIMTTRPTSVDAAQMEREPAPEGEGSAPFEDSLPPLARVKTAAEARIRFDFGAAGQSITRYPTAARAKSPDSLRSATQDHEGSHDPPVAQGDRGDGKRLARQPRDSHCIETMRGSADAEQSGDEAIAQPSRPLNVLSHPATPTAPDTTLQSAMPAARQILKYLAEPMTELIEVSEQSSVTSDHRMLKLVLHPDHLGEVEVVLRLGAGRLSVEIRPNLRETKDLLHRDIGLLGSALSEVVVGHPARSIAVSVGVNQSTAPSTPDQFCSGSQLHEGTTFTGGGNFGHNRGRFEGGGHEAVFSEDEGDVPEGPSRRHDVGASLMVL